MSNRLFVGNLSFNTSEDALRDLFAGHGVRSVKIMTDRETGRSRGFGFLEFADDATAKAAMQEMNGATVDGRQLRVDEAAERGAPRSGGGGGYGGGGGGGYGGGGGGYGGGGRRRS